MCYVCIGSGVAARAPKNKEAKNQRVKNNQLQILMKVDGMVFLRKGSLCTMSAAM